MPQAVGKPQREAWRAGALQTPGPGGIYVGFGSPAGFLTPFTWRAAGPQVNGAEKAAKGELFRQPWGSARGCASPFYANQKEGMDLRSLHSRYQLRKDLLGWLFLLPSLVFLGCFSLYPIGKSIVNSFQKVNLGKQTYTFIGLTNYVKVFQDKTFQTVLGNTFLFAVIVIPLSMVIGFFLASLVKREHKGVGFARALIYYPNIAPTIGFATVWTYLLTPTVGLISQLSVMAGIPAQDYLNNPKFAIYTIMVVYLWREAGFVMIFYTSGLQNISQEYYEAARIDGASAWTMLRKITLPLVRPTTVFVLTCTMANSFKMVDLIVTMTTKGGPNNSTNVLMYHIYQTAFSYWDIGQASVMTVVMLVFMLLVSMVQFTGMDRSTHYDN